MMLFLAICYYIARNYDARHRNGGDVLALTFAIVFGIGFILYLVGISSN